MANVVPIRTRTRARPGPILPVQGSLVSATNGQMRDLQAYANALCQVRTRQDAAGRPVFYELANSIQRRLNRELMPAMTPASVRGFSAPFLGHHFTAHTRGSRFKKKIK